MSSVSFPIENYEKEVQSAIIEKQFTVFLCGPTLQDLSEKPSSVLRQLLLDDLRSDGFSVVLGEDDGLMELQDCFGGDAQTNELGFIKKHANAVVLVADSSGSFSELGLFAHFHSSPKCNFSFIIVVDEFYRDNEMYLSLGPVKLVESRGKVFYANFKSNDEDFTEIVSAVRNDLRVQRFSLCLD
ncbi:hypothetical protein [Maridesulfovibrio sp.]|uniref:hypothetical protein n=1 Tax=Maridesulfovibrio sp. TaxID=2795000 RepID=UPI002A186BFB|nr:hypothetical protein [Maridesulfovibrio sp.]